MRKILFISSIILLSACHSGRSYFPSEADMTPQQVRIERFDSALMAMDTSSSMTAIRHLYDTYPDFMPLWVEGIMGVPCWDTAYLADELPLLLSDTIYVPRARMAQYNDITTLQNTLNKVFTRLSYLDLGIPVPTVYLYFSGYNSSIFIAQDQIGVGIDMYLGSDFEVYDLIATVYAYQKHNMCAAQIPVELTESYLERSLPYTASQNRLLDQMIYLGSIKFLTAQVLDDVPEWQIMGWTKEQYDWCVAHEQAIWHHMMDHQHLYSMDHLIITNYLKTGPFTLEISQDSPAQIGIWIGWRIIEQYMANHEQCSLHDLFTRPELNAQTILESSHYKP